MNTLFVLVIPPMLLLPTMGLLSAIRGADDLAQEVRRKALHVLVGLTALAFPAYFTEVWMIITALGLVVTWLIAVRAYAPLRRRFGHCLHDAKRVSHGEIYFAMAIALLLLIATETPLLYVIPVLILALSDAAAAIVGKGFPMGRLSGQAAGKTVSGSTAFFIVAYLLTVLVLAAFTSLPLLHSVGIAIVVAGVTCIVEMLSRRGLDNILVPIAAYLTLLPFDLAAVAQSTTMAQLQTQLHKQLSLMVAGV